MLDGNATTAVQTLRLQAEGKLRGRIIGVDGRPIAGLRLRSSSHHVPFGGPKPDPRTIGVFPWTATFGSDVDSNDRGKLVTDEDGRFEVSGLLPDLTYSAQAVGPPELSNMFTSMGDGDGPMIR